MTKLRHQRAKAEHAISQRSNYWDFKNTEKKKNGIERVVTQKMHSVSQRTLYIKLIIERAAEKQIKIIKSENS
jgi:hypothetical protein